MLGCRWDRVPLTNPARRRRVVPAVWAAAGVLIAATVAVSTTLQQSAEANAEKTSLQALKVGEDLAAAYLTEEASSVSRLVAARSDRSAFRTLLLGWQGARHLTATGSADVARLLTSLAESHDGIRSAALIDENGRLLATTSASKAMIGRSFASRDWYRGAVATRGTYLSEVYRAVSSGAPWTVSVAAPIFAKSGDTSSARIGVVTVGYEVTGFQSFAVRFASGNHARLRVFDQHGKVVADSSGAGLGSVPAFGAASKDVLSAKQSLGDTGWSVVAELSRSRAIAPAASLIRLLWLRTILISIGLLAGVGIWTRVRRHNATRDASRTAAQRSFLDLLAGTGDIAAVIDRDLRVVAANGAFWDLAVSPHRPDELSRLIEVLAPELGREVAEALQRCVRSAATQELEVHALGGDGGTHLLIRIFPLPDAGQLAVVGTDITAQVESREALRAAEHHVRMANEFFGAVLSASPDLVFVADLKTNETTFTSRPLGVMLGDTPATPVRIGSGVLERVNPEDLQRLLAMNQAARQLADGEVLQMRYRLLDANGDWQWYSRRITPFSRSDDGFVEEIIGLLRDISDVVAGEEQLQHTALHDGLTGLPNRSLLHDRLTTALTRAENHGEEAAVLFCDLDGFKRVNDSAGHAAGDAVLLTISKRLQGVLREGDTIARVGGDEFVIVLEPNRRTPGEALRVDGRIPAPRGAMDDVPDSIRQTALEVATRIKAVLEEPVRYKDTEHVVSASLGIAFAGPARDGVSVTADEVLRDADSAMYQAKLRGKDRHEIFESDHRLDLAARARVEQILRNALRGARSSRHPAGSGLVPPREPVADALAGSLSVAYQPILDLTSGELVGFEALSRLRDGTGELIAPDLFIAVAEDTGLIAPLGSLILDRACCQLAEWRLGYPELDGVGMAVNLSARQAQDADLSTEVFATLEEYDLRPDDLTLELTETVLLHAGASTISSLRRLHEAGIRIAIDDFGTGYSSLRYLATLPVNAVKVDKSFTAGLPHDTTSSTIVRAVVSLAADLGLACIVEGIETQEQIDALPPHVLGQGYYLGRPTELEDLAPEALSELLTLIRT